jgi:dienelactone hydrolase
MASEWVSTLVDGQDMRVYLAQPGTTGQIPRLLVITEAFGVPTGEVTDKLAREGYTAVAPVLYHRLGSDPLSSYTGDDAEARTKAMAGLRGAELVHDLNTAVPSCTVMHERRSIAWGSSGSASVDESPTRQPAVVRA